MSGRRFGGGVLPRRILGFSPKIVGELNFTLLLVIIEMCLVAAEGGGWEVYHMVVYHIISDSAGRKE